MFCRSRLTFAHLIVNNRMTALDSALHDLTIIGSTRKLMVDILQRHSLEAVNKVPAGFNNNLIWNAAHCWATLHITVFERNGVAAPAMDLMTYRPPGDEIVAAYRKGTRPTADVEQDFVDNVCNALSDQNWYQHLTPEFLLPERYTTWISMWGVELKSVTECLSYMNMHEGLHFGAMLALQKFV